MADHFDFLAPIYDRVISPPDPGRLKELLKLPSPGRLLDAGGGTGRASAALRPLVDHLVLSDLSRPMLQQSDRRGDHSPVQAHAEHLPFTTGSFARVLVVDALHHFCDQPAAIGDLLRVLMPGGRLVIEDPDIRRWQVKMVALAEKLALMRSHFHAPEEIQAMARAHQGRAEIVRDGQFTAWVVVDKA